MQEQRLVPQWNTQVNILNTSRERWMYWCYGLLKDEGRLGSYKEVWGTETMANLYARRFTVSLGDSTSLLRLWSCFCSGLCVSCPALQCNWIITSRAATMAFSSFTMRGRHAWCPQRLSAYLALLIAQQKCSMGQGTRQLERQTPGRSSCQSVRLERRKWAKIYWHTLLFSVVWALCHVLPRRSQLH